MSVIFRACFFHYCISTLNEAGQVVRRERGLPNERGPKARQCNKHSALLHKHTFYKSLKTSATVAHASAGTGLALTRQQTHAVYVSGGAWVRSYQSNLIKSGFVIYSINKCVCAILSVNAMGQH